MTLYVHYITQQVCDGHVTTELLFPMDLILCYGYLGLPRAGKEQYRGEIGVNQLEITPLQGSKGPC